MATSSAGSSLPAIDRVPDALAAGLPVVLAVLVVLVALTVATVALALVAVVPVVVLDVVVVVVVVVAEAALLKPVDDDSEAPSPGVGALPASVFTGAASSEASRRWVRGESRGSLRATSTVLGWLSLQAVQPRAISPVLTGRPPKLGMPSCERRAGVASAGLAGAPSVVTGLISASRLWRDAFLLNDGGVLMLGGSGELTG